MTEKASGAMTAQDVFFNGTCCVIHKRNCCNDCMKSVAMADALSARNTEELENKLAISSAYAETAWDQVEKLRAAEKQDEQRLRDAAERAGVGWCGCDTPDHLAEAVLELRAALTDAQREIQMANDALGGNPAVHLCDRINQFTGQLARLRDQGAQREAALRKAHEWAAKFPLGDCEASPADINAAEEVSRSCEAAIRGLASPVEGSGQCPLCGSKSADTFEGKCLEYRQHGEPAHIFHWRMTSDEQRSGMCWAGLASPPEGTE